MANNISSAIRTISLEAINAGFENLIDEETEKTFEIDGVSYELGFLLLLQQSLAIGGITVEEYHDICKAAHVLKFGSMSAYHAYRKNLKEN